MSNASNPDERALLLHATVAADLLDAQIAAHLAGAPLSPREFEVATVLATRGAVAPGEIATVTGVPAPSVSRITARLLRDRLVAQREHPSDARSRLLDLTPAGRRAFDATQERFALLFQAVAEQLGEALPLVDGAVRRLEWALRTVAGVPSPEPLVAAEGDAQRMDYAGQRLSLAQEAEVTAYIAWIRSRDAGPRPR
jgi:DNA-binding MarR family transcriptional regulator